MDYLRVYAEELGLEQVLGAFTKREDVQGAILTLDDGWFAAWKLSETGRLREWEWRWREWRHFMPGPMPPFFGIGNPMAQDQQPWIPTREGGAAKFFHFHGADPVPEGIVVESGEWLYGLEADAFAAALAAGRRDVPQMSVDDTLGNMAVLDAWRACGG
jgi:hypothetical protein